MTGHRFRRADWLFLGLLAVFVAVLGATTVRGTFIIDDANHIAAVVGFKSGHFGIAGTEHLPPSSELLSFDPAPRSRAQVAVPAISTIPPLYAVLAWPFSFGKITGLQWLNALGVGWATLMVYLLARRFETASATAWFASALFLFGSYVIEYAQGIWAHGLSLALCSSAFLAAALARERATAWSAIVAGLCAGLATGVRYQNAVVAGLLLATVVLLGNNRRKSGPLYAAGCAVPLVASSLLNHVRYGYWNPISKGPGYLAVAHESRGWAAFSDAVLATWARVVDASAHPAFGPTLHGMDLAMPKEPDTGAFLVLGVVRKAMLQSSPWLALGLVAMLLSWVALAGRPPAQRRELQASSIVVFGVLASFAYFGFSRTEGWSFNQRYMLDTMPLGAVATAWALERLRPRAVALAIGFVSGFGAAMAVLWSSGLESYTRILLVLTLPILLAGGIVLLCLLEGLRERWPAVVRATQLIMPLLVSAGLGWALLIHVAEDVRASRNRRSATLAMADAFGRALPKRPSALFVYWGTRDALPGLYFSHDIVILDTWVDGGRDAPRLVDALLGQKREVFVAPFAGPQSISERLLGGREVQVIEGDSSLSLLKILK